MMLRGLVVALLLTQELKLSDVPEQVPAPMKAALREKRAELQERWASYEKKKSALREEFKGITKEDPRIPMVQKRMAAIKSEGDGVVDDADAYHDKIRMLLGQSEIDARIATLELTLKGPELAKALQKELDESSRRIDASRAAIQAAAVRLQGYPESIDEWSALTDQAAREAHHVAADAVATVLLEKMAIRNEEAIELDLDVLNRISKAYRSLFAGKAAAPIVAENLAHLENKKQVLMLATSAKAFAHAAPKVQDRQETWTVLLKTIDMLNQATIRDPRISLLIADGELIIADSYLIAAKATAHARVNQILEVEAAELKGLTSLTRLHRAEIDRRKRLRARIEENK